MELENTVISIKEKITFKKRINTNRRHFPSKLISLIICILFIASIFVFIELYKKCKSHSSNIKRKMSTYNYGPKYESKEQETYASYGLIFILVFICSFLYLISLILKFFTNGAEKIIFFIILIYAFFIDISYIIAASFIIGKIPSVQIGYVLSPYILLPAFITLLFVTKAICLCCKISMIDYLITFFSLPISHFSIILNFTCCCTELGGRIPSSESNQGRNAITVIRFATSNNQINSVQERNIAHSNAGEYSIPFFKKDDCLVECCCGCLRIFCYFLYLILALATFPLHFIFYYIGLIAVTVLLIPFYIIYIFPLLISFLCAKCCECCCKEDDNNDNNQIKDKLSYEYYCNRNKTPLVLTFLVIILLVLSFLVLLIMKYLFKIENKFTSFNQF